MNGRMPPAIAPTTAATTAAAAAAAAASAPSKKEAFKNLFTGFFGKIKSLSGIDLVTILVCATAISIYIAICVLTSNFASSSDDWVNIKPEIQKMWIVSLFGMIFFIIAAFLLYSRYPDNTIYVSLVVACVALGLSFNALAISAIRK